MNIIAEAMFAQCDENGNEYVLLEALVDYEKEEGALLLADQVTVVKGKRCRCRTMAG